MRLTPALPARYRTTLGSRTPSVDRIRQLLAPGQRILDIGAGRRPTIPPEDRPAGTYYVGTDIIGGELDLAPVGSFDEARVFDVTHGCPDDLVGQFDLVICVSVIEHVRSLAGAVDAMRAALKPGGVMVFHTAGRWGLAPGVANRVIPRRAGLWLLERLTGRPGDTVFPAHYDHAYASAMGALLRRGWRDVEITPLYFGGYYLVRTGPLLGLYLLWEELTRRARWSNLATHYTVVATKDDSRT